MSGAERPAAATVLGFQLCYHLCKLQWCVLGARRWVGEVSADPVDHAAGPPAAVDPRTCFLFLPGTQCLQYCIVA